MVNKGGCFKKIGDSPSYVRIAANQNESGMISLDQRLDKYDDLLAVQNSYLQSLAEYTLAQYKIYIRQRIRKQNRQ